MLNSCCSNSINTIPSFNDANSCNSGKGGPKSSAGGPPLPSAQGRGRFPAPISLAELRAEASIDTST